MSKRSSREVYDRLQTAHSKNNTLLNSRDIQYRGWKGREVVIRIASDKILRMRFFIAGDKLYTIFYGGPPLTERVKEVDAFFASLRLYAR